MLLDIRKQNGKSQMLLYISIGGTMVQHDKRISLKR
jgi:hypothetical protein